MVQRERNLSGPVQRIIESNGIRLNIAEQGKGPPVILCHGFPESWYSWRHQLTALAAAGFHAVAPDMRGYGKSDRPEAIDQYTIFHLIGDLVGLLDALEAPTAVIVGHDWGAAYRLASGTPAPRPLPRRRKPQRTASAAWSGAPDQRDAADRGRAILPTVFPGARRGRGRDGAGSTPHYPQHALRRVRRRRGGIPRCRNPRRDHARSRHGAARRRHVAGTGGAAAAARMAQRSRHRFLCRRIKA